MPSDTTTPARAERHATGAVLWLLAVSLVSVSGGQASQGASAPAPKAELLERVVAVVDDRPLLLSDVRALAKVRGLDPGEALREAIDERLMYAEASRAAQAEVVPAQESAALAALLQKTPALRSEVPEADLRRLVHRQIAILRYVEYRFRPQVRVSDDDVRRAWEREEVGQPAGPALEDALETIRKRLEQQMVDEKIESWIKDLRARADVREVGAPLGGAGF